MDRLAVFFPGIGYTVDKPLMYYSRKIASEQGYETKCIPYSGFPEKIPGDSGRMERSFQTALRQAEEMLSDIVFEDYDEVLFAGKSIGTIVAARIASLSPAKDRIRLILYTPLEETFLFDFGEAVVFTGTEDPWTGGADSRIAGLAARRGCPCFLVPDANHSLETKCAEQDIRNLQWIMDETTRFIRRETLRHA